MIFLDLVYLVREQQKHSNNKTVDTLKLEKSN